MTDPKHLIALADSLLLADVVGYETDDVVAGASGLTLDTYGGQRYIDFTGGIAVHACGHCHPDIVNAIATQAAGLLHISDVMRHPAQLQLGEWLHDRFCHLTDGQPWSMLFMNSGSESNDAAAKLALKATGRSRIAAFTGAFHGRTLFASLISRSRTRHWAAYEPFLEPLRSHVHHVRRPHGVGPEALDELEALLEAHGSEIAALFFESIQGEGGYVPLDRASAERMRDLTRRHGVLLIADEIQSGCGRTGRWFGFEHLGIVPDIVTIGKAIGGGLPLAGVAAPEALMSKWKPGEHGTTFGGNPVACAAGLAAIRVIEREGLVERADSLGDAMLGRLEAWKGQRGVVDVRGRGLMIGIELRSADGTPAYDRCDAVKAAARERGLLVLTCGARIGDPAVDNAAIRLIPPLNTPEPVVEDAISRLDEALSAVP